MRKATFTKIKLELMVSKNHENTTVSGQQVQSRKTEVQRKVPNPATVARAKPVEDDDEGSGAFADYSLHPRNIHQRGGNFYGNQNFRRRTIQWPCSRLKRQQLYWQQTNSRTHAVGTSWFVVCKRSR